MKKLKDLIPPKSIMVLVATNIIAILSILGVLGETDVNKYKEVVALAVAVVDSLAMYYLYKTEPKKHNELDNQ